MSSTSDIHRNGAIIQAAVIRTPVLAALNAALAHRIGSPTTAAFCLFLAARAGNRLAHLVTGPADFRELAAQPPNLLLGGILVAFHVLPVTVIAPGLGIGNAVFFVLLGQPLSAATIDHFGLFGARVSPLGTTRATGLALMSLGSFLTKLV